ncbi:hypothetical protein CYLTODRAFT_458787 [Cylindrobasidium torrendii FP15055 ss-10]|uniref:Uncharacterized protein n=1 Tax=Cylindrobasidium torrendii FP15055 ss-10 TaxID=1314674 RepID=A0A0D7AXT4_9AGAR|nr:hypothetical protein CYLTODRAFT_458787 [Cylindrobasidium torrendii FP15055 ss-10]
MSLKRQLSITFDDGPPRLGRRLEREDSYLLRMEEGVRALRTQIHDPTRGPINSENELPSAHIATKPAPVVPISGPTPPPSPPHMNATTSPSAGDRAAVSDISGHLPSHSEATRSRTGSRVPKSTDTNIRTTAKRATKKPLPPVAPSGSNRPVKAKGQTADRYRKEKYRDRGSMTARSLFGRVYQKSHPACTNGDVNDAWAKIEKTAEAETYTAEAKALKANVRT